MATRRPLVVVSGTVRELPAGDTVPVPRALPFVFADGTNGSISLTTAAALPFLLGSGASSDIPLTL